MRDGNDMNLRLLPLTIIGFAAILISAACASKATPTPDAMATNIASGVSAALTLTATAPTRTPIPTATPTPTITPTEAPIQQPFVNHRLAACWFGPGSNYHLESNISRWQQVEILGVGSVSGWYIIRNPYFQQPCWVLITDLQIDPRMDLSQLPVMTPIPLRTPYAP